MFTVCRAVKLTLESIKVRFSRRDDTGATLRSVKFYTIKFTASSCIALCSSKSSVSFS